MSARRKAPAAPVYTVADVTAAAQRAHVAAVAALRAVQLPDAADALESAGTEPVANEAATRAAISAVIALVADLRASFGDVDEELIRQRRAVPDDMYRDDKRWPIEEERKHALRRYLSVERRVDAARSCVSAAAGVLAGMRNETKVCEIRYRGYWLKVAMEEAEIALECARGAGVSP